MAASKLDASACRKLAMVIFDQETAASLEARAAVNDRCIEVIEAELKRREVS